MPRRGLFPCWRSTSKTRCGQARQRLPVTLLGGVGLFFALALAGHAQTRLWARGSFTLPMEVEWAKTKLAKGEYRFKVESTSGFGAIVSVSHKGNIQTFLPYKREWVRGGKGLRPQLLLHIDPDLSAEVFEMQIPGPNFRLKFSCRHKKKKGQKAPARATVPLTFN